MVEYSTNDPNRFSGYYAEIQKHESKADLQNFLKKMGEPKNLTELAAIVEAKDHAVRNGFADLPAPQPVNDRLRVTDVENLRDLFQRTKDVNDRIRKKNREDDHMPDTQTTNDNMTMSTMRKQALEAKHENGRSFTVEEKRYLCRDIDIYHAKNGIFEEKLSVLMLKFEDAKFVAIKRGEIAGKIQDMERDGRTVPEVLNRATLEGERLASCTMQDLQAVLPAADITRQREEFINMGTPSKLQQVHHEKLFDRVIKNKDAMAKFREEYAAVGDTPEQYEKRAAQFDEMVKGKKTEALRESFIHLGAPSEEMKKERGQLFDRAMQDIRDYGTDIGRKEEFQKLLEPVNEPKSEVRKPKLKNASLDIPPLNIGMATENNQGISPAALRQGLPPAPDKLLS